jgi:hypothetical protein
VYPYVCTLVPARRIGGLATRKKELPTALGSFLDGKALSQSDGEGESGEAQVCRGGRILAECRYWESIRS